MVAIRLRRAGSKKRPFFRVVVTDSRAARDSSFVEILGHYNPRSRPAVVQVDKERLDQWVKNGAQMSSSVRTLVARHLTPAPAPAAASVSASADTLVMARPAASAAESSTASAASAAGQTGAATAPKAAPAEQS